MYLFVRCTLGALLVSFLRFRGPPLSVALLAALSILPLSGSEDLPEIPLDDRGWEQLFDAAESRPAEIQQWMENARGFKTGESEDEQFSIMLSLLEAYSGIFVGKAPQSVELAADAVERARNLQSDKLLARALQVTAMANFMVRHYAKAEAASEEALAVIQEVLQYEETTEAAAITELKIRASALTMLGNIQTMRTDFVGASEHYINALRIFEELKDDVRTTKLRVNLANVSMMAGKIDAARTYYEQALEHAKATNNLQVHIVALANLGPIYQESGQEQKEFEAYTEALKLARERGLTSMLPTLLINLGDYFLRQNDFTRVRELSAEAIAMSERSGDSSTLAVAYVNLGLADKGLGLIDEAMTEFARAEKIFLGQDAFFQLRELYEIMADTSELAENYKGALAYFRSFKEISDNQTRTETSERLETLRQQYDEERKEREIIELRQANEAKVFALEKQEMLNSYQEDMLSLQQAQLRREAFLRNAMIAVLAVLFLSVVLLVVKFRSERQAKAHAEKLNRELLMREEALRRTNLDLTKANQEKDDLLGIVSHDLKNPIAAIQGIADLLLEDMPVAATDDFREMVGMVRETTVRMFSVVSDLLDSYRMGSSAEESERKRETFDFAALCASSGELWEKRMSEKGQTLAIQLPDHPVAFYGERTFAIQIIDNLLSNAIKYTPLNRKIDLSLKATGGIVELRISDEGPGIPKEELPRLFQKFAKLSPQPTGGEHSTGIGLSIVHRRVEDLGGKISCESERGKGSTFIVTLPLRLGS